MVYYFNAEREQDIKLLNQIALALNIKLKFKPLSFLYNKEGNRMFREDIFMPSNFNRKHVSELSYKDLKKVLLQISLNLSNLKKG